MSCARMLEIPPSRADWRVAIFMGESGILNIVSVLFRNECCGGDESTCA